MQKQRPETNVIAMATRGVRIYILFLHNHTCVTGYRIIIQRLLICVIIRIEGIPVSGLVFLPGNPPFDVKSVFLNKKVSAALHVTLRLRNVRNKLSATPTFCFFHVKRLCLAHGADCLITQNSFCNNEKQLSLY